MGKATLIISDTEDGEINIKIEFDPAEKLDSLTPAQAVAVRFVEFMQAQEE